MAKKRPKISLEESVQPRTGDMERLFATDQDPEQVSGLELLAIRLDAIEADPHQPRRTQPEGRLQELSESIAQNGVIQPVEVTEIAIGRYKLVHGERRWRAAAMAGLETIPAVVRRQDYDTLTRFVRQLVENIQREDLNDVDRAAGLLHLRDLMQQELDARSAGDSPDVGKSPWAKTITWAKVGQRLGYSRQRIHQLIHLLDLPETIKEDVREGRLSERDTRVYQGLQRRQQRQLHQARYRQELSTAELRQVVQQLKEEPAKSVTQAIKDVRRPPTKTSVEQGLEVSFERDRLADLELASGETESPGQLLRQRETRPSNIDRLEWIRGHLARIHRQPADPGERREMVRLLSLIEQDVQSLLDALSGDGSG
jgi:ParB family transcriptional regulator, chromosome partitioning protein